MQPDIEIYVLSCPTENIINWLNQDFEVSGIATNDTGAKLTITYNTAIIPVTILEKAAGKRFTSVWFDSAHTPWDNDAECAKQAYEALACEIRCNIQGWKEDSKDDPDLWWRINSHGEGPYIWR